MDALYIRICEELVSQLHNHERLMFASPPDVDRHDDDIDLVDKRIIAIRGFRDQLEKLL